MQMNIGRPEADGGRTPLNNINLYLVARRVNRKLCKICSQLVVTNARKWSAMMGERWAE